MLPADMKLFRHAEGVFTGLCRQWGYQEIRTPVLEYLHLFTAAGTLTPAKLSQTYSFLDWDGWSGERVVLRPDSTIPAARLYIDNLDSQEKARLYYVQNVFTFEATGRENREKWQCGAEFIGGSGPAADAEIVFMAGDILKALEIDGVEIQLSHAGLIKALLGQIEPDPSRQAELFDRILDGNTDGIRLENGAGSGLGKILDLIFNYSGRAQGFLKNVKAIALASLPALRQPLDDFIAVVDLLAPLNGGFTLNIASGRGFEYYTGTMVQFTSGGVRVGGGGRYDDLVSLTGGRRMPACGFALYLDRLAGLLKSPPISPDRRTVTVAAGNASPALVAAGIGLCRSLHNRGYQAVFEVSGEGSAALGYYIVLLTEQNDRLSYALVEKGRQPVANFDSPEGLLKELADRAQARTA